MPVAKKDSTKKKTPYDLFNEEKVAFLNEHTDLESEILVRGIESSANDSDDDDDDDEIDTDTLTKEQMESLRYVMLTKERIAALEAWNERILGDQANDSFLCFNTSFSYTVFDEFSQSLPAELRKKRSWKDKFNTLFAFTHTIHEYDVWMHDNEEPEMVAAVAKDLGKRWKAMLQKSDQELGIDSRFTRPGILAFLENFKKHIQDAPSYDTTISFRYE